MMYNFDEHIERRNTNSYKWDTAKNDNVLPMWVADMDFRAAQPIIDALSKRVQHGVFGYTKVPEAYYTAIISWFARRYRFRFHRDWILFTTGVVPALSAIIKALTVAGDQVIVQSPVYNCFFSSIRNNQCEIVTNNLIYTGGTYSIDFEDLEKKASDAKAKLLLLCNPHNPVGRVWTKDELIKVGEVCARHGVIVVSDEIHCDLTYPGHEYIPYASLGESFLNTSVTCIAPGKTFNIAGLQVANIIAADKDIQLKIDRALNINEVCEINPLAVEALMTAYNEGEEWLEQLKHYLFANYIYVKQFFNEQLPLCKVVPLEGTYLLWIDCVALQMPSAAIARILLEKECLFINEGTIYGDAGEGFIRLNIACSRQLLTDGLNRIKNTFG